jgi:hypothetical protein
MKLEQPVSWPEYGSYIMVELLEVTDSSDGDAVHNRNTDLFVRF